MAKTKSSFLRTGRNIIRTRFTKKLLLDVEEAFKETEESFYKDFNKHPISQELRGHTYPSSILNDTGWPRRGTLFGFMGFLEGRDPVQELENFLRDGQMGLRAEPVKNIISNVRGIFGRIKSPTPEEMAAARIQLDGWGDGRAWPEVLEDSGIDNLSFFYAGYGYGSRSQEGFQAKHELNPGNRLPKMQYLSPMLVKFEKRFSEVLRRKAKTRRRKI